jgi:pimeloyl-ACP methyl ester carboxylesterase
MAKARVNDIEIYYEMKANGFPLIMINGLSEHTGSWDPYLISGLSKRFKLLLFDVRGSGRTDISDKEYSIKLFADDTAGLMNAVGIPRAHVLGLSLGGMIAQELALSYPERIEKLLLCSTRCGGAQTVPTPREKSMRQMIDSGKVSFEEMIKLTLHRFFTEEFIKNNPEFIKAYIKRRLSVPFSKEAIMRYRRAMATFGICARLPQIKASTLIIHGKQDVVITPENAQLMAEKIPQSKVVYFENSGHLLAEDREKILATLIDFLAKP